MARSLGSSQVLAGVFAVLLVAVSCASGEHATDPVPEADAPDQPIEAELDPVECWEDAAVTAPSTVECFTATVPEDHGEPDGPTVTLPVAVVNPQDAPDGPPTVFLDGGPGGDGLTFAMAVSELPIGATEQVVIVGQRGSLHAEPTLMCSETIDATLDSLGTGIDQSTDGAQLDAFATCRERLDEAHLQVEHFDTPQAADDVDSVRRALGHESWNLYGISYGTRLALEVLRRHPDSVNAVVLDSVLPPDVEATGDMIPNAQRAFEQLAESCHLAGTCSADLLERLAALHARLEAEPVPVTVAHPLTGEATTVTWDGDRLADSAFLALYRTELIPLLPTLLTSFENGDFELATTTLLELSSSFELVADGLYANILCREIANAVDVEELETQRQDTPDWLWSTAAEVRLLLGGFCDRWPVEKASPELAEPVTSEVPVLVLAGDHDPITPPSYGLQAAETLSNATFLELSGHGHGVSTTECGAPITAEFLADPEAALVPQCEYDKV